MVGARRIHHAVFILLKEFDLHCLDIWSAAKPVPVGLVTASSRAVWLRIGRVVFRSGVV